MDHQMLKQELLNKTINAKQDCVKSEYLHILLLDLLQKCLFLCAGYFILRETLDSNESAFQSLNQEVKLK